MADSHPINICPNCGHEVNNKYCPECGQATELHDETVKGLLREFINHYFYYDSKFWRTMKTLWFKPGALTAAYWSRQRAKYLPPLTLYFFITGLYFLIFFMVKKPEPYVTGKPLAGQQKVDSITKVQQLQANTTLNPAAKKISRMADPAIAKVVLQKAFLSIPKIVFFMIPIMGLMLWLFFMRRKTVSFVHHIVFSIHWHTFYFSIFIFHFLSYLSQIKKTSHFKINIAFSLLGLVYFVLALQKAYKIHTGRAILYGAIMTFVYFLVLMISIFAYMALTLLTMK